jgi:hypothetical protein
VTEREWDRCTEPGKMLEVLKGRASDRKLRLFVGACARKMWDRLTDPRSRAAVALRASGPCRA